MARRTFRFASRCVEAGPIARKDSAASIVPAHVRKSFAVTSRPVTFRRYMLTSSARVDVLEELTSRKLATPLHDARDAAIRHRDGMRDAALAAELESERCTFDRNVTAAKRRQTEGVVHFGELVAADANQRALEQP